MRAWSAGLSAAILVLIGLIVACGGSGEPAGTTPSPYTPEPGVLAEGFPDDFPVYPEADVVGSRLVADTYFVLWATEDDVSSVVAFYEDALAQEPWQATEKTESETDGRVLFQFESADVAEAGTVAIVERADDGGRTEISVRLLSGEGGE